MPSKPPLELPSELPIVQAPQGDEGPRWYVMLRSQGLGLICGQLTVLLLAIGSFVIANTRTGASREVRGDDIRVNQLPRQLCDPALTRLAQTGIVRGALRFFSLAYENDRGSCL